MQRSGGAVLFASATGAIMSAIYAIVLTLIIL